MIRSSLPTLDQLFRTGAFLDTNPIYVHTVGMYGSLRSQKLPFIGPLLYTEISTVMERHHRRGDCVPLWSSILRRWYFIFADFSTGSLDRAADFATCQ